MTTKQITINHQFIGQKFGRLSVLDVPSINKFLCRCECGKEISALASNVKRGNTTSCGCAKLEIITKHGHSPRGKCSSEYSSWHCMCGRCCCPTNAEYPSYGGRGIAVCPEWHDFQQFLADMGLKPTPRHSIDRIDSRLGYNPANCRWATPAQQTRNTTQTHFITFEGRTMCLTDWALDRGINKHTLAKRVRVWGFERALSTPTPLTVCSIE